MSEPVVVFRTHSDIEAAVVRGLLDSHGVQAFLSSDLPNTIFPLAIKGLGEVRISVPAAEADEARRLIEGFRDRQASPAVLPFDDMAALEARLGYRFRDRGLLDRALTHRSRAHEADDAGMADNESLEFLGDAVLGLVVADVLYRELPDAREGRKSKIKAALVSRSSLSAIAEALDLGAALRLGRGEEKTGGRRKQALLADACEAIIAAIYLDGGLDTARTFLLGVLKPSLDRITQPGAVNAMTGDYKSALQEWLQSRGDAPPDYRLLEESGPDHRKRFVIAVTAGEKALGQAEGATKKAAEQGAAHAALVGLGVLEG